MPSPSVKEKFRERGSQTAFAKFARVKPCTVTLWLQDRFSSARLEELALSFTYERPTRPRPEDAK